MRVRVLGAVLAVTFACAISALATDTDCGPTPTRQCVAGMAFAVAKTLPDGDPLRESARVAEVELAPANLDVAVRFLDDDYDHHPHPWEEWLAQAGLFERAVAEARSYEEPEWRTDGLIRVAHHLANRGLLDRSAEVLKEPEVQLGLASGSERGPWLRSKAARIWAKIGETERSIDLLSASNGDSVAVLLELAREHPAAASRFREHARTLAQHANTAVAWMALMKDAAGRGDVEAVAQTGQAVLTAPQGRQPRWSLEVAANFIAAGLTEEAARAIESWRRWVGRVSGPDRSNLVNEIVPLLARLGRDSEIAEAADMIAGDFSRSGAFTRGADLLFRLGRASPARSLEERALAVAEATPTDSDKGRWEHNSALRNLALTRSRRSDVSGALDVASRVLDPAEQREITVYIARAAIDGGHAEQANPAIAHLEILARKAADPTLLLQAALYSHRAGQTERARIAFDNATNLIRRQDFSARQAVDLELIAEVMWSLDHTIKPVLRMIDEFGAERPQWVTAALYRLVDVSAAAEPLAAVAFAKRLPFASSQVMAFASVAAGMGPGDLRATPLLLRP